MDKNGMKVKNELIIVPIDRLLMFVTIYARLFAKILVHFRELH